MTDGIIGVFFFFFQAEDGIRDKLVTGVQTCALPIFLPAEWVLTGRVFDGEEARAGGLVSRVVAPEALLPTARELALEIARNTSAVAVALARQMLWRLLGADHPMEAHRLDSQAMFWTGRSTDAYEGVTAFLEKRPPRFTLRPSQDMPPFYPWWQPRAFK